MYAREVDGQVLEFEVSGRLYRNALVMLDQQTGSLWSQILGAAILGPLKGTRLTMLPSLHTTWGAWRREHPNGLLLKKEQPSYAAYAPYWGSQMAGVTDEAIADTRLRTKQLVLGVRVGDQAKAYPYPLGRLSTQPVINDSLGRMPMVVVFDQVHGTGGVFSRQVQDRVLTFALARKSETTVVLTDKETGTQWHGLSGAALVGPLEGQRLTPIPATLAFWFGWKDHFPNTAVWSNPPS